MEKNRGKTVEHKIVPVTTGLSILPEPGGLMDQPNWTIDMFHIFRAGDMAASSKMLK